MPTWHTAGSQQHVLKVDRVSWRVHGAGLRATPLSMGQEQRHPRCVVQALGQRRGSGSTPSDSPGLGTGGLPHFRGPLPHYPWCGSLYLILIGQKQAEPSQRSLEPIKAAGSRELSAAASDLGWRWSPCGPQSRSHLPPISRQGSPLPSYLPTELVFQVDGTASPAAHPSMALA